MSARKLKLFGPPFNDFHGNHSSALTGGNIKTNKNWFIFLHSANDENVDE